MGVHTISLQVRNESRYALWALRATKEVLAHTKIEIF